MHPTIRRFAGEVQSRLCIAQTSREHDVCGARFCGPWHCDRVKSAAGTTPGRAQRNRRTIWISKNLKSLRVKKIYKISATSVPSLTFEWNKHLAYLICLSPPHTLWVSQTWFVNGQHLNLPCNNHQGFVGNSWSYLIPWSYWNCKNEGWCIMIVDDNGRFSWGVRSGIIMPRKISFTMMLTLRSFSYSRICETASSFFSMTWVWHMNACGKNRKDQGRLQKFYLTSKIFAILGN